EPGVDETAAGIRQRHAHDDDVDGGEQGRQLVDAVHGTVGCAAGAARHTYDLHLETGEPPLNRLADAAVPEDEDATVGQRRPRADAGSAATPSQTSTSRPWGGVPTSAASWTEGSQTRVTPVPHHTPRTRPPAVQWAPGRRRPPTPPTEADSRVPRAHDRQRAD